MNRSVVWLLSLMAAGTALLQVARFRRPGPDGVPPSSDSIPKTATQPAREPATSGQVEGKAAPTSDAASLPDAASQSQVWRRAQSDPSFREFAQWSDRYLTAPDAASRSRLEAEGRALAETRRLALRELIPSDPEAALSVAVPRRVRARLPQGILQHLEEPLSARGDFGLLARVGLPGEAPPTEPLYRTVSVGDRTWKAYTFGAGLERLTLYDIPIHGIALDGLFALDPNPVRAMEAGESETMGDGTGALCAYSPHLATEHGTATAVDTGSGQAWVCGHRHLESLNAAESLSMKDRGNGQDMDGAFRMKSTYTEGIKRLLIVRVDFSDLAGVPLSDTAATNMLNGIDSFFREQSFGKTGFRKLGEGSVLTTTLRMPKTAAVYGASDASVLRTDARNAARTAGVVLSNYDFDLICFGPVPGFNWAGLGYVGAPGSWIRASFDAAGGVSAHELGHNFGLNHANFWDTGGQSVIGSGSNVEYGDSFDTMGNASAGRRHFNARYKNFLDWMPNTQVRVATASGTFRVWAHDQTNAATHRALRVVRNSQTNYWLEFRQQFADRPALLHGLGLRWGRTGSQSSLLLDTTPGTADGKNDSALLIGRTFSDAAAGIHITPVAKGGTIPESLDVVVNIGRFTNNLSPDLSLSAPLTNANVNVSLAFTAAASDPDGDTLAYSWDFGDGTLLPLNTNRVSHSWTAAGEYVVRCTVSDMKGGVGSRFLLVRIGTPNTVRIAGRILRAGEPVQGVRVEVSNTRQSLTDNDGHYLIAGLARGPHTVKAVQEGLLFTRRGFVNPLSVQTNRIGIDFEASLPGDLTSLSLVPFGAQWRYHDGGNLVGTGWRSPAFSDSNWRVGAAPLGYGDDNIVTSVGFGGVATNKHITTWFRHSFVVEDPTQMQTVTLGLIRDDGAAVFVNGREGFRSNLPTGTLTAATRASASVGGTDETAVFETEIDPAAIQRGTNVIAVEVHQFAPDSSDLRFSLQLAALLQPTSAPPKLALGSGQERIRLAWPQTSVGFQLEESDSPDAGWRTSDESIGTESGVNFTVVPTTNATRFYRLRRP